MTEASLLARCTIVIPTHRRPACLRRCVSWFARLGMPIIVADSSESPSLAEGERAAVAAYLHRPGGFEIYLVKLAEAVEEVATPYVALCADDDLILPAGLAASIAFLDRNESHSFAQGYAYLYQVLGRRLAVWPMPYHAHEVPHEDWRDRVDTATSTVYYGVQRTAVLRRSLGFLARAGLAPLGADAIGLIDFAMTVIAAREGKFRRVPVPFALREYSPVVSGVGFRFRTIVSPLIPAFYAALLEELARDQAEDADTRLRLLRRFGADYAGQIAYDLAVGTAPERRLDRLPGFVRRNPRLLTLAEYAWRRANAARLFASRAHRGQDVLFRSQDYARARAVLVADG